MKQIFLMLLVFFIFSCTGNKYTDPGKSYANNNRWLEAISAYQETLKRQGDDVETKSKLHQTRLNAADYYYRTGQQFKNQNNYKAALLFFESGAAAMPENDRLQQELDATKAHIKANERFEEAVHAQKTGRIQEAKLLLEEALQHDPSHEYASKALHALEVKHPSVLQQQETTLVTLHFKGAALKDVVHFITKPYGINVIFDDNTKNKNITIYAKDVTLAQGLGLISKTANVYYKEVGNNTILITEDSNKSREKYDDYYVRTFHLKAIQADAMAEILQKTLGIKTYVTNASLNTILIRDKAEILEMVEKVIATNDIKTSEVLLEVEILEVSRTKTEQLGMDYGSQVTLDLPEFMLSDLVVTGGPTRFLESFSDAALNQGTVVMPDVVLRYLKRNIDAKTLSNPKIRAVNLGEAKIHVGERVPLRSSTIQDATGQIRTTFEYRDIGIRLNITPQIHSDNNITVKLNLEVSSLGQNLGTLEEPAFSIGTRNIETEMLLKDHETAVLGGLIRDEDRKNKVKLPGLGNIPVAGRLFATNDDENMQTEILLTITPRIVRSQTIPHQEHLNFFSGSKKDYRNRPDFHFLQNDQPTDKAPQININYKGSDVHNPSYTPRGNTKKSASTSPQASYELSFDKQNYASTIGGTVNMTLTGSIPTDVTAMMLQIDYDPTLVELIFIDKGSAVSGNLSYQSHDGKINMTAGNVKAGSTANIATLSFRPIASGNQTVAATVTQAWQKAGRKIGVSGNAAEITVP